MWNTCRLQMMSWYVKLRPIDVMTVDIGESRPLEMADALLIESIQSPKNLTDRWIGLACLVQQRTKLSSTRIALLSLPEFSILVSRVGKDVKDKINAHNKAEHAGWSAPLSDIGGRVQ